MWPFPCLSFRRTPRSFILPPVPHGHPIPRLEGITFTRNLMDRAGYGLAVSSGRFYLRSPAALLARIASEGTHSVHGIIKRYTDRFGYPSRSRTRTNREQEPNQQLRKY